MAKKVGCYNFEREYCKEAIKTVQQWSDAHKANTYLKDFLKKYPNASMKSDYEPCVCVRSLYNEDFECSSYVNCRECWNQPMKRNDSDD